MRARMRSIINGIDGVDLLGIFLPTSEWHYVMVMKATSHDKRKNNFKVKENKVLIN